MASVSEHIAADFSAALAEDGVAVVIDGTPLLVFDAPVETEHDAAERMLIASRKMYHLEGAIDKKYPGQVVVVDGERWTVEMHWAQSSPGPGVCLVLSRVVG